MLHLPILNIILWIHQKKILFLGTKDSRNTRNTLTVRGESYPGPVFQWGLRTGHLSGIHGGCDGDSTESRSECLPHGHISFSTDSAERSGWGNNKCPQREEKRGSEDDESPPVTPELSKEEKKKDRRPGLLWLQDGDRDTNKKEAEGRKRFQSHEGHF